MNTSRRMFLRTASGMALGLPFLPSLLPRSAEAGGSGAPKRLIAIQSQSGQFVADFWPTRTPAGYQTRDTMYGGPRADGTTALNTAIPGTNHKWAPLADFAGQPLSPVLTGELEPWLSKLLLVRGLDYLQGTSHGSGMLLGNYANCAGWAEFDARGLQQMPTIDQVLAYSNKFYPEQPRMRTLALSTAGPTASISDSDYGVPGGVVETLPSYIEPLYLWEDLFGDFMEPGMPVEHPNRKLVNAVYDDYARLRQNTRLSQADKQALDRHMSFMDDIERELAQGFAAGCVKPPEPEFFDRQYPYAEVADVVAYERMIELLVDVAVAALRCDMTRIVTVQAGMAVTDASGSLAASYHSSDNVAGDWHDFAHDALGEPLDHDHIVSLNRWVVTKIFKRFVEQLDVEEVFGETYLDNSLVYWGGELSMDHYVMAMPTILAGGAGGALETGYYVDYTQLDHDYANAGLMPWGVLIPGIPHNRLLVTILQAMGLSPGDYERDGRPGYGHNEFFPGVYNLEASAYDMSTIGEPLPGIWKG
jgi:hypothetical protein